MLTIYYFQITTLLKKHINWYWKTKFKAFIVSHCKQPSLYTNIAKYFNELFKKWQLGLETDASSTMFGNYWQLLWFVSI